ncbi:MAG: heme-dependent peroxidase [Armatimonadetes bacterium]|nr:heme-dependent peroxidase [Armatimonadota bacterium]
MVEVPETLEGWYCLHDFRRVDWPRWKSLSEDARRTAIAEAVEFLRAAEEHRDAPEGSSGLFSVLGHKADLLFLHLRPTPDDLNRLEYAFARTALADYLTAPYSYTSVTELGLYEAQARGGTADPEEMRNLPFVQARLKPPIPDRRYLTFYPMNKRRGEHENWYTLPLAERRAMMRSHGTIGHKYFGIVQQMITGSVGFDDWEWGVTLFAEDPLQFKKLVYEMRFDEVSAKYAEFGPFLLGVRVRPEELSALLSR